MHFCILAKKCATFMSWGHPEATRGPGYPRCLKIAIWGFALVSFAFDSRGKGSLPASTGVRDLRVAAFTATSLITWLRKQNINKVFLVTRITIDIAIHIKALIHNVTRRQARNKKRNMLKKMMDMLDLRMIRFNHCSRYTKTMNMIYCYNII